MSGIKSKKFITILVIVLIVVIIISLSVYVFILRYKNEISLQIKDENGDNKSLCVITDEYIEEWIDDYRVIKSHRKNEGTYDSGVKGTFADCDCRYTEVKFGMFSGIYIMNAYLGHGNNVKYVVESNVISGNFRIVVVNKTTNKIMYDIPIDEQSEITFYAKELETYYIKLVGESANVEVKLWRSE